MALINCPECNGIVSNQAEICPKCSFPIKPKTHTVENVENKEGCFLQTLNTGCMILFCIIAAIIVASIIGSMF